MYVSKGFNIPENLAKDWWYKHVAKRYPEVAEEYQNDTELWESVYLAMNTRLSTDVSEPKLEDVLWELEILPVI
jgi:hypothetical protein|tara:strand:+ start:9832 stop:10053 length:222 start_codon:yes stop_codon:yes gene_type:complete